MKNKLFLLAFLLLLFNFESFAWKPPKDFVKSYVVKVIDGDTIEVKIPKTTFNHRKTLKNLRYTVRLIGIDTPEKTLNKRAKIQAKRGDKDLKTITLLGKLAYEFTKKLIPKGSTVYLEFDVQPQDRYGRLLAYIWLPDGRMLNREIICNGYAYLLTKPPNLKYADEFRKCFRYAQKHKLGLWQY
ncbi:MAG: thermonuclease [Aquificae bacterium]|nr:thermonuclease [Aquificota bacterium]